ncbi:hypothetical protein [Streptomyces sp. NPDC058373]|uniref:hypothetical protein n=1 Tax=Streptomyces sp. NPDC058373 TaxID=3346465 RepID=UPI0036536133
MSDTTPSQAEGERDEEETRGAGDSAGHGGEQPARTTPSQAEGDRDDEVDDR